MRTFPERVVVVGAVCCLVLRRLQSFSAVLSSCITSGFAFVNT